MFFGGKMRKRLSLMLLFLPILINCVQEKHITTPKALTKKSDFVGDWYFKTTIVEKQSHSSFGFNGLSCPLDRVHFQITEDRLMAFRSYGKGTKLGKAEDNQLLASFAINGHFDLKKEKDAVVIDSKGRPFDERDYIDVDWSQNLVPSSECNGWLQSITSLNINRSDNSKPKEVFRLRQNKDYIETTVDALVQADPEACFDIDCLPAEYRVKFSFARAKKSDYEARIYPDQENIHAGSNKRGEYCLPHEEGCVGNQELWLYADHNGKIISCNPLIHNPDDCFSPAVAMNAQFGFFRSESQSYDRRLGMSRRGRAPLINRWNIWEKSRKGLIPLAKRQPKKIIYYLNPGFPKELHASVKRVAQSWNQAFLHTVAAAKNSCTAENIKIAKSDPSVEDALIKAKIPVIFEENLKDACAVLYEHSKKSESPFFSGKLDEIRETYGSIFEIRENDCNEKNVQAYAAQHGLTELMRDHDLAELNNDNIEEACAFLEWQGKEKGIEPLFSWQQLGDVRYSFVNAVTKPEDAGLLGYGPLAADPLSGEIINASANIYIASIKDYALSAINLMSLIEKIPEDKNNRELNSNFNNNIISALSKLRSQSKNKQDHADNFMQNLHKAQDLNFSALSVFKTNKFENIIHENNSQTEKIIKLIAMQEEEAKEVAKSLDFKKKSAFYSSRSACFMHAENNLPYARLRADFANKSLEEKINALTASIFEAVLAHELGHTFGLRHNFKGAYDAMNYPPEFYGLKNNDFRARPGLEKDELRSSSIMDYHKYFNSDFSLLGAYDYAALAAGYAEKIEVFDESEGAFVPRSLMPKLNLMHYEDLPYIFSGGPAERIISRHLERVLDRFHRGDNHAHVDIASLKLPKNAQNLYKRRYVDKNELFVKLLANINGQEKSDFVPVPYAFCTDAEAGRSDLSCQPFIFGSSPSEIVEANFADYRLLSRLRKIGINNFPQSISSYMNYVYNRVYLPVIKSYNESYHLAYGENSVFPKVRDLEKAVNLGLTHISEILETVEPGSYCKNLAGDYLPKEENMPCEQEIVIDASEGEELLSELADGMTMSTKRVGFIYEKILALLALVDSESSLNFSYKNWERSSDSIGLYHVFAEPIKQIFSSIFTGSWQERAAHVHINSNNTPIISYNNLFNKPKNQVKNSRIFPSMNNTLRDYAILFSMAGLTNRFDHRVDFAKVARISRVSGVDEPRSDGAGEEQMFSDPHSGIRYYARGAMLGGSSSPAVALLKDAHCFVSDCQNEQGPGVWFSAKKSFDEAEKEYNNIRKTARINTSNNLEKSEEDLKRAESTLRTADKLLREKVRVIEIVRELSERFAP
jgi:predicted Zn-dependent protease